MTLRSNSTTPLPDPAMSGHNSENTARATTRRGFLLGTAGILALGAAGCRGGTTESPGGGNARVIEHKFGSTEISGKPSRVVTVGLTEQDYAIALGVVPVGVREWFGQHPGALWPWARDAIGDAEIPKVLPVAELDFDQIVTLEPDLVLGVNSGLTRDEYDTLSKIAPTVAQPKGHADYGAPWQEMTRIIGRALDEAEKAEQQVADIEGRFQQVKQENAAFGQSTGLLATSIEGQFHIYAEGPAPGFLTQLGLTMPKAAEKLFTGENRAPVSLSSEQLRALESDVLLLGLYGAGAQRTVQQPLYQALNVSKQGRALHMPQMSSVNGALSFGTVLSLPLALDELVPRLPKLLDGDPNTSPEPIKS